MPDETTFVDQHHDLVAKALGGDDGYVIEDTPEEGADAAAVADKAPASEEKAADTPAAEGTKKEEVKAEVAETTPAAEAELTDPAEKYLAALRKEKAADPVADDNTKAYLKTKGVEDIDALLQERATDKELVGQYKGKADKYDAFQARMKDIPTEIAQAIEAFEKGEDYTKPLLPLTRGITLNKEAKDIDKFALVQHRHPGKFTPEQVESLRDGTADPSLQAAHDLFYEQSAQGHDTDRNNLLNSGKQKQERTAAALQADQRAVAEAIAFAKADEAVAVLLTPELLSDFENGTLVDKLFYNADGTPNRQHLALAAKLVNHDTVVARVLKGAQTSAEVKGELRARDRMPEKPDSKGAEKAGPTIKPHTEESKTKEFYDAAQDLVAKALG